MKDVTFNASANILPIGRWKGSGVDRSTSALDFLGPRGVDIRLRFRFETFKKANRDFSALLFRKTQHLIQ